MKRALVTGGTGFIGAHVVRKLVERGYHVVALVRPTSNLTLLKGLCLHTVIGDLTDFDSLIPPMRDIDELYHVAADYRLWARNPHEIYLNNVAGTRNVLEAAFVCGVSKVVYTSSVGCLGIPLDGSEGDETTPVEKKQLVGNYKKSKFDAEQAALEYVARGLDVVIVNPSTPVGPGDIKPTPTGKIVLDFLNGNMRGFVDTGLNLIAVEDVAEGHILAAERGTTGEKYILGNRNMTLREILETLAHLTNRKSPTFHVPHFLALAAAIVDTARCKALSKEPCIPIEGVLMSQKKMFFSSAKAVRELGLPQSSVEDALARSIAWFEANGYVKRPNLSFRAPSGGCPLEP